MMAVVLQKNKKADRIIAFLRKELDLPQGYIIGFDLHMHVDGLITVKNLEYQPYEDEE